MMHIALSRQTRGNSAKKTGPSAGWIVCVCDVLRRTEGHSRGLQPGNHRLTSSPLRAPREPRAWKTATLSLNATAFTTLSVVGRLWLFRDGFISARDLLQANAWIPLIPDASRVVPRFPVSHSMVCRGRGNGWHCAPPSSSLPPDNSHCFWRWFTREGGALPDDPLGPQRCSCHADVRQVRPLPLHRLLPPLRPLSAPLQRVTVRPRSLCWQAVVVARRLLRAKVEDGSLSSSPVARAQRLHRRKDAWSEGGRRKGLRDRDAGAGGWEAP